MKNNSITPWAYQKGKGFLYRIPGGIKLIFFLGLSFSIFFLPIYFLPVIALLLITLSLGSGLSPRALLRGSKNLFIICVMILVIKTVEFTPRGINIQGLYEGIFLCLRMGLSFSTGALLYSVTTMGEIRKSLAYAETFLHIKKLRLSLGISLMLMFLPRFFEIWEDTALAWESRAGRKNFSGFLIRIPQLIERLMEKAAQTAAALESRGALISEEIEENH